MPAAGASGPSRPGMPPNPVADWIAYFRDLGIHDFYRVGDIPASAAAEIPTFAAGESVPHSLPADTISAGLIPETRPTPPRSVIHSPAQPGAPPPPKPAAAARAELPTPQEPALPQDSTVPTPVSFNLLAPLPPAAIPAPQRAAALRALQEEIGDCTRCPLAYAGRRTIVFGDGSPAARLMFVGEGPGADEDVQGLPFVGKAGQLLNNMITAMGLARGDVYIANIVKCRPPANRVPEPVEANTCSRFLLRQIDIIRPEVIVALGSTAATYLLGVKQSLSSLRGSWHSCRGAKLAVTYHPAFLLRDPRMKAEAWKDLQMVMKELGLKPPPRG